MKIGVFGLRKREIETERIRGESEMVRERETERYKERKESERVRERERVREIYESVGR